MNVSSLPCAAGCSPRSRWPRATPRQRPPAVGRTMLVVWLLALAWHLLYALAVPLAYTNDRLAHFAQQLLAGLRFPQIASERTPGYPAFIALVIRLFGNSALTYFHWTDMSYFLDVWRTPVQTPPPAASDESLLEMMPMLVYRWHPQRSPLRTALIDASKLALRFWWVTAGLALASALPLLAHPTHYRLLAGWLYWLTLVAAGAVLAMPVDRYVIVVEPLLNVLAAAGLEALLDIRQRQLALV